MAFTCPRCSRASHNPADAVQGYCGACRMFTGSSQSLARVVSVLRGRRPAFPRVQREAVEAARAAQPGFPLAVRDVTAPDYQDAALEAAWSVAAALQPASVSVTEMRVIGTSLAVALGLAREPAQEPETFYDLAEGDDGPEPDTYPWDSAAAWHPGYSTPQSDIIK